MISTQSLELLQELLNLQEVPVGHPDFEVRAPQLVAAKKELTAELDKRRKGDDDGVSRPVTRNPRRTRVKA